MVNLRILKGEIIDYFKFTDKIEKICGVHTMKIDNQSQHSTNKWTIFFLRNLCLITLNIFPYFDPQGILISVSNQNNNAWNSFTPCQLFMQVANLFSCLNGRFDFLVMNPCGSKHVGIFNVLL
jgi:hypothetical protein